VDDYLSTALSQTSPQVFTLAAWFRTNSHRGGKIIGFSNTQTGTSTNYDREITMDTTGKMTFWVYNSTGKVIGTTQSFNDGEWHHVAATIGASGMASYIDGSLIGTNANTAAQAYNGYWKIGYNTTTGTWQNMVSPFFEGDIDDVRIYDIALGASDVNLIISDTGSGSTMLEESTLFVNGLALDVSPNPFNPSVNIMVNGCKTGGTLKIFDMNGKMAANLTSALASNSGAGSRQVSWNASGFASGVYVVMLNNDKVELKRKIMLIR
jgi:hypothetical protein